MDKDAWGEGGEGEGMLAITLFDEEQKWVLPFLSFMRGTTLKGPVSKKHSQNYDTVLPLNDETIGKKGPEGRRIQWQAPRRDTRCNKRKKKWDKNALSFCFFQKSASASMTDDDNNKSRSVTPAA